MSRRLLVVEDEPAVAQQLERLGRALGFEVRLLRRARGFAQEIAEHPPDAVVINLNLPDDSGIWLLRQLARAHSRSRVVIVSGVDQRLREAAARLARAYGLELAASLGKPFDSAELEAALRGPPLRPHRRRPA